MKTLDINNQERLTGVIDLVFEKAIEEPNFSEAYAAMCNKLSVLKVRFDLFKVLKSKICYCRVIAKFPL